MEKLDKKDRCKVLNFLRNMPAKECEEMLNYLFVMKVPESDKNVDLIMHKAIVYKIQRRLEKTIIDLCGIQSVPALRQYLDRAFIKIYKFLKMKNIEF